MQAVRYAFLPRVSAVVKSGEEARLFAFVVDDVTLCLADLDRNGRFDDPWIDALKLVYLRKGERYPDPSQWAPLWTSADLGSGWGSSAAPATTAKPGEPRAAPATVTVLRVPVRTHDCRIRFEHGLPVGFRLEDFVVIRTAEDLLERMTLEQMQEEDRALRFDSYYGRPGASVSALRAAETEVEARPHWKQALKDGYGIEPQDEVQRTWERENVGRWNEDAKTALAELNRIRGWVGLPPVRPSPTLSYGSWRHARHLALAKQIEHHEIKSAPGRSPAGAMAGALSGLSPGLGSQGVFNLANTVFHRDQYAHPAATAVGIGLASEDGYGVTANSDAHDTNPIWGWQGHLCWPADGALDVPTRFQGERPQPIPERAVSTAGSPVTIHLHGVGKDHLARSRQVSDVEAEVRLGGVRGRPVPAGDYFLLTPEGLARVHGELNAGFLCVLPKEPWKQDATYWVRFAYTWRAALISAEFGAPLALGEPERRERILTFTTGRQAWVVVPK